MVTKAEFIQWHHVKKGHSPTDADMRKFYEVDSNGDGSISIAEFEAYTLARVASRQQTQVRVPARVVRPLP